MEHRDDIHKLIEQWTFNWGVMGVLIGGKSTIDLPELRVDGEKDATEFLRYYGYDPENPSDGQIIHGVLVEAIHFIENYLIPDEWAKGLRPPPELLTTTDARFILQCASDARPGERWLQAWACAILRVMHTIAHIEGVTRLLDIDEARSQIMGRIKSYVFRDAKGILRFGTPESNVELYSVDWKHGKSRESILVKLLHKRANVAENIYDYLGVRIVTKRLCDVMQVSKYLRDYHLVSFPNCNPGRARNSLIDVEYFHKQLNGAISLLENGKITRAEFHSLVSKAARYREATADELLANPHSAKEYRAVQLTGRQMIRVPSPIKLWQEKFERLRDSVAVPEANRQIIDELVFFSRKWRRDDETSEYMGFFPFEVHILDEASYQANKEGEASHDRYKSSQIRAARRRVLGRVLALRRASGIK